MPLGEEKARAVAEALYGTSSTRETLAAYAHEAWSGWMEYLFSKTSPAPAGQVIPLASVQRWSRQMRTPYADLPENEKQSDREQADRILETLRQAGRKPGELLSTLETCLGFLKWLAAAGRSMDFAAVVAGELDPRDLVAQYVREGGQ